LTTVRIPIGTAFASAARRLKMSISIVTFIPAAQTFPRPNEKSAQVAPLRALQRLTVELVWFCPLNPTRRFCRQ
jgi:hypothetical protein